MSAAQPKPLYGKRRARQLGRRFEAAEAAALAERFSTALTELEPPLSTRTRALLGLGLRAVATANSAEDCWLALRLFWNDSAYRARLAGSAQLEWLAAAISPAEGWFARLPDAQQQAWSAEVGDALERSDLRELLEDTLSRAGR